MKVGPGEHWEKNQSDDFVIENILNTMPAAGNPQLEVQVVGRANLLHQVEISVGPSSPSRIVGTLNFAGAETSTLNVGLNWSDIGGDGRMVVRVRVVGVSGAADRASASYVKLNYPKKF